MNSRKTPNRPLALIIDDEPMICKSLGGVLSDEGWGTITAGNGRDGMVAFKLYQPDLVFLDVWMPGIDGIETLQHLKQMNPETPVVIMSGHGTIETAVRATRLGAWDYLEKPMSIEKILPILRQTLDAARKRKVGSEAVSPIPEMIASSAAMQTILNQVQVVAPRNAGILITGENGTGKEVLARSIHAQSQRAQAPFVAVNCAAIPDALIESELFGHVKGAFTGAIANQKGRFEQADKGTLFLDEIGDMSLRTQAKILRVLQEQTFERLGSDETLRVDVRVIAATNEDLNAEIAAGRFREDLFYRLNVVPFYLPPLRERADDIERLGNFFLRVICADLGEAQKSLSDHVLSALRCYSWPGNVRELRNLMERLCIMVPGDLIEFEDLPENIARAGGFEPMTKRVEPATLKEAKSDFERAYILDKLQENQWNVTRTAEAIGIERSNLHRKLKSYNIDPKQLKD